MQVECWRAFAGELPWLCKSDRLILELASRHSARMQTEPTCPMAVYSELRLCLSAMCATPVTRSKLGDADDDDQDPLAEFMN